MKRKTTIINFQYLWLTILFMINRVIAEVSLSPYALWNQNGITVAGWANGSGGSSPTQLDHPYDISITSNDILYVSDLQNNRIVVVHLDSVANISIIGSGFGSNNSQLNAPWGISLTNTSLYVIDLGNHRVQKTSLSGSNLSTVPGLSGLNSSYCLYVDNNNNIYLSDTLNDRVLLFISNTANFTIVAGTGVSGGNNNQLNRPYGIFVTQIETIYIADCYNHRIMKWLSGASVGTIVAGDGTSGASSTQLSYPSQVIVDTNEYLYISEVGNFRVTRWAPNSNSGVCIVACSGTPGINSNQLSGSASLTFDTHGSLYVSDIYNNRVQKFTILNYSSLSYNLPKFSSCAIWNPTAITFAAVGMNGSNRVNVFVSSNNTVYVSMGTFNYVLVWLEESNIVAQNISAGLDSTFGIFSTINGDIYMDNGAVNHQLNRWSWNTTGSVGVVNITSRCFSLFIDVYGTLYCSFDLEHSVVRIVLNNGANSQTIIAGNGTSGFEASMLNYPNGISLDKEFNLYVADCGNHRIQKFPIGQLVASTVAGNGTPGLATLSYPTAVILDADEYIYICDNDNHRIIRSGPFGFQCLVGCASIPGSAADQLNHPHSISFDSYGNLFVVDSVNNRIQKFLLATNSCAPSSYNQPKFSTCATWNPNAITFADSITVGSLPVNVFVTSNNTVYVVSNSLNSVLIWLEENITLSRTISDNLTHPHAVFTTINGDIYIANNVVNRRLQKWSSNGTTSVVVMNVSDTCFSLFIDISETLYCSLDTEHKVVKMLLNIQSSNVIIAAGNGIQGSQANTLRFPNGIFVDKKFNLYVADCLNNRIQLFQPGQPNGTTMVGAGAPGTIALNYPFSVILDAEGYIFIADWSRRIIRSGPSGSQCLLGCTGTSGFAANQLNKPYSLSFDSYGNLFVVDSTNSRIQKFLLATNTCVPSYNQPKFCPLATWNLNATTIANQSVVGTFPAYLFVDITNTLYAAEQSLGRVQIWLEGQTSPTKTISGGLNTSVGIFVALNGDVYVDNGVFNRRVDKWTLDANVSVVAMYVDDSCFGLFIDVNDNLYCSLGYLHKVVKKLISDVANTLIIAAGTGTPGNTSFMLNGPRGIFVDLNANLYVADCWNHRIQLFRSGLLNGTTIPINGSQGILTLDCPTAVVLDIDNYLFISDWGSHRVLGSGPAGFRCIVGCTNTSGSASNQLYHPHAISFDTHGNLFVFDTDNHRLQKFFLALNSCDETTTAFLSIITSTENIETSTNNIQSTSLSIFTLEMSVSTDSIQSSSYFLPSACSLSNHIGVNCNISALTCDLLQPCLNYGTCITSNTTLLGYNCSCLSGFNGTQCQFDHRRCQLNTCWNDGTCDQRSNATFLCQCAPGWQDNQCQTKVNYCDDGTCLNRGICRPLLLNYSCLCLTGSYSGRLCEVTSHRIIILQIISKSFAYVVIVAIVSVALFVVILDLLKYGFGIDPARQERQLTKSKKQKRKKKPVKIVRFTYIHAPEQKLSEHTNTTVQDTSV